jgi:ornithine cyclodeaminase/alanine dehydrogenase-like protein (mu-crystallin family)
MRSVSGEEIRRVLTLPILIAAMERGHRRPRTEIHDRLMGHDNALYFVRSAADHGRAFGSKLVTSFPDNRAADHTGGAGLPAVQGVYVLFDGTNGRPVAVLDGTEITWWKTAADSALGDR